MPTRRSLHDSDFYAWSLEQAALLRAGGVGDLDLAAIAEEIESMGKTEKRELISRLTVLLLPLLKWQRQPGGRGNSWRLSIADARDEIADSSTDNPSLKDRPRRDDGLILSLRAPQGGNRDGSGGGDFSGAMPVEFCGSGGCGVLAGVGVGSSWCGAGVAHLRSEPRDQRRIAAD